ncbi:MAG: sigma-54 dependent transcriptional regulator [Methylococcaceae bacterium]|nr:sigma-54 dependent transcriptional regulator [Methylococcaceae bacterium]
MRRRIPELGPGRKSVAEPHILVVDDEPEIRALVRDILEDEGYEVSVAENATAARQAWQTRKPELILLDIWMPDSDGISVLKEWLETGEDPSPVIMMSGHGTVETAVEATRLGAFDFLEKPLSLAKLLLTVERALEANRLQREYIGLKPAVHQFVEPIGKSAAIERLKEQVRKLAQYDTRVLLTGEPGCGKECFAHYLHVNSHRKAGPFIDVAVGTIAPEYSAVEFFGKEESAKIHYGLLEQAHGGTLYLGEVGDMDDETQLRLLSALESQSFLRVGGSQQVNVDVRIIASTRRVLEDEINAGRFRRDLYYLLNVVSLNVPPLREHSADVPELLNFYVDYFMKNDKLAFRRFTVPAQNFLRNQLWNGNVRELKNLVQRLLILGTGDAIELDEVKTALGSSTIAQSFDHPEYYDMPLKEAREYFEKTYLEYHLSRSGGSVAKLSAMIGMERTHLYRKLNSLGIRFKEKK